MVIYKYRKFLEEDGTINNSTFRVLTERELWFTNPDKFNDLLDTRLRFDYSRPDNLSVEDAVRMFSTPENIKLHESDILRILHRGFLFCCFAARSNIGPMWAHYSGNHTGMALGFEVRGEGGDFGGNDFLEDVGYYGRRMKYQADIDSFNIYQVIDYVQDKEKFLNSLFTKKDEWQHESEVRIAPMPRPGIVINPPRAISFQPNSLKQIVFGFKMTLSDRKVVKRLVETGFPANHEVAYLECYPDGSELGIRPCDL